VVQILFTRALRLRNREATAAARGVTRIPLALLTKTTARDRVTVAGGGYLYDWAGI
jgi:hypothetical protein